MLMSDGAVLAVRGLHTVFPSEAGAGHHGR